ncbi:MAG: 3-dehydroquinate synthase [Planctomycetes bacterium]|nr:3-dehydroquinate synthase [Planctomycetota bacterium]
MADQRHNHVTRGDDDKESSCVQVVLPSAAYPVHIGSGLLSSLAAIVHACCPRAKRVLLVQDAGVPSQTRLIAAHSLASEFTIAEAMLTATEAAKSADSLAHLWSALADAALDRDDAVVALGGGIVTDVAGFAAATYRRGIPVIQCPTTLLSMVDASVGGKTGINLPSSRGTLKNMAGSFHQPAAVVADVDTLNTLTHREFRAGMAEVIKHALIEHSVSGTSTLLPQLQRTPQWTAASPGLADLIAANVRIKASVVAKDERETASDAVGGRALLNLGHTFAHAIEPLSNLSPSGNPADAPLKHGEAVGLGLIAAAATSRHLGLIDSGYQSQITGLVASAGLPTGIGALPPADTLIERMRLDKKVRAGSLRLILPTGTATAAVLADVPVEAIRAGWRAIDR